MWRVDRCQEDWAKHCTAKIQEQIGELISAEFKSVHARIEQLGAERQTEQSVAESAAREIFL